MVVGLLGNKSPDSNRFTLVTPKPENGVRLQATLGNQNPTGLPVGAVREGLFDRLFIDWYWVGKTKAWNIEGTDDLRPYIYGKTLTIKWATTLVGYPVIAAILAGIMSLIV